MNIYISGISGTGMGPLALMAKAAGLKVFGSDLAEGAIASELYQAEIPVRIGESTQDGSYLQSVYDSSGVDWFVYTSALPSDHPELALATSLGLRVSKRDELISYLVDKLGLLMVAVAGTHGKTTTVSMIIWTCLKLGLPISYLVGTTLPFAASGCYEPKSRFLVYEADEYDRNFLHFSPWLSVITSVSYDHPDVYASEDEYRAAFRKFAGQSEAVISAQGTSVPSAFTLAGEVRRRDAELALQAVLMMCEEAGFETSREQVVEILNEFPGVGRRFERICAGVYSDYAHHPEEIAATVDMAREEASRLGLAGVVAVYEPHQNSRQHEVFDGYAEAFSGVSRLYWLPTYLTREDPELRVISPSEFVETLDLEPGTATASEVGEGLAEELIGWKDKGYLVLLMTAGPADEWLRKIFARQG